MLDLNPRINLEAGRACINPITARATRLPSIPSIHPGATCYATCRAPCSVATEPLPCPKPLCPHTRPHPAASFTPCACLCSLTPCASCLPSFHVFPPSHKGEGKKHRCSKERGRGWTAPSGRTTVVCTHTPRSHQCRQATTSTLKQATT